MFKTLQKIYEYFFAPWDITVIRRDTEGWTYQKGLRQYSYSRESVTYKYSHKFRQEEKIVKEYLNDIEDV